MYIVFYLSNVNGSSALTRMGVHGQEGIRMRTEKSQTPQTGDRDRQGLATTPRSENTTDAQNRFNHLGLPRELRDMILKIFAQARTDPETDRVGRAQYNSTVKPFELSKQMRGEVMQIVLRSSILVDDHVTYPFIHPTILSLRKIREAYSMFPGCLSMQSSYHLCNFLRSWIFRLESWYHQQVAASLFQIDTTVHSRIALFVNPDGCLP